MASLEFALLAEFARVDSVGLLTVVGGGFIRVQPPQLPSQIPLHVAFGVSKREEENPSTFQIEAAAPHMLVMVGLSGEVATPAGLVPIDGRLSINVAVAWEGEGDD